MFADYKLMITCILIGYVIGIITSLLFRKENYSTQKQISLLLSGTWMIATLSRIAFGTEVPILFDLIGAGSIGANAGLDLVKYLAYFKRT